MDLTFQVPMQYCSLQHWTLLLSPVTSFRDQMMVSRTWVMFTRKRQDMCSSCLANHVTPATPVTETKNCLYISRHTPLFGALVGFCCAGWDLGPSTLEIKLHSCLCITMVDLLSLSVGSEIRAWSITTFTTGYCFCFGSIPSFFLELFLHQSPVAYWAPSDLGSSPFSTLSFCPFHTVPGVLKVRILKWFPILFSSGPHCVRPLHHAYTSWVAPQGMA